MRRFTFFVLFLLLLVVIAGSSPSQALSPQTQQTFTPTALAWVSSAEPDANFGGQGFVWVGYGHGSGDDLSTLRGLAQFDLSSIPAGATISSARLYATIWGAQGPDDHFLYCTGSAASAWDEASVNWQNKPVLLAGGGCTDISATSGQVSWDVTSLVQEMAAGLRADQGFYLIRENDTTDPQEHTRQFGVLQLVVTYETVAPTATPTTQPALQISKSDQPDPVYAGDDVVYTITVHNVADHPISNLGLQDTIPGGTTFVEATNGGVFEDGIVTWEIPSLYMGATYTVELTLRTSPSTPDGAILTNQVVVSYLCSQSLESAKICSQEATETTTVRQPPSPSPTPIVSCRPDEAGNSFADATVLTSGGSGKLGALCPAGDEDWYKFPVNANEIIDGVLSHLSSDFAAQLVRPDGAPVATFDQDGQIDESIQWQGITAAQAGDWRVRIFDAKGANDTGNYRLTMLVRQPTPTPTRHPTRTATPRPTPTPTATPVPAPSLTLGLTLVDGNPVAGEDLTYSIRVTNTGSVAVTDIHVHDTYPDYTGYQSASPPPDDVGAMTISWPTIAQLNPGASFHYRLTLRVQSDVPDGWVLENEAYATASGMHTLYARYSLVAHQVTDLTITDARVIQAITPGTLSGVDEPIPMIEGKYTTIRVMVQASNNGDQPVSDVSGRLYYYHPGEAAQSVEADNAPIAAVSDPGWRNNNHTLNFFLPTDHLSGEVRWWVEINTDHRVRESDYTNNRWPTDPATKQVIQFRPARSYRVGWVPIAWGKKENDLHQAPSQRIYDGDWFLQRTYPLDLSRFDYYESGMSGAATMRWTGADWDALIADLNGYWDMLELYSADGAPDQLIGWLPADASDYGGLSDPTWNSGRGLVAFADDGYGTQNGAVIAAHEIGHNLGLLHPCEATDWPYPHDYDIQRVGFDPYESHYGSGVGVKAATTSEYMTGGWCGATGFEEKWISPAYYKYLVEQLTPIPLQTASTTSTLNVSDGEDVLLVSGAIRQDHIDIFSAYKITAAQAVSLPRPPEGNKFCLALKNSADTNLDMFCLDGINGERPQPTGSGYIGNSDFAMSFSIPFAYPDGLAKLVAFEQNGPRRGELLRSAHDPQITALYPDGGLTLTEPITATWQAGDADGDALTYAVLYSADDGSHWQPLTVGLHEPQLVLDPASLPGSQHARLRVIATDGIRTVQRGSRESFVVPGKPPQARILTPEDGAEGKAGMPVNFLASGFDREDGILRDDTAFTWYSSLDGPLGHGRRLVMRSLSVGQHTITLTVSDSSGSQGSDSITINIVGDAPPPCQGTDIIRNGDFEQGNLRGWQAGGMPRPRVIDSEQHSGNHALLLPGPGQQEQQKALSFVRQYVHIPADATDATLSFWYKVGSTDTGNDYDWFGAYLLDPAGEQALKIVRVSRSDGWQWAAYDVSPFRGQTIGIGFFMHNDGQAGNTWAFVDDVRLCSNGTPPTAPKPDTCALPADLPDYAPAGLPDFDQHQSDWQTPDTEQWSHDAATALADLLWWRDSMAEPGETPPPAVADGHNLVRAYGPWDDHDPQNVAPLIDDLATRMATDMHHHGADLNDVIEGLNTYLESMAVADDYTVALRHRPSFDWVQEEVKQQRQVMLLLGFWELQSGGWKRLGGHYVAVAGAPCDGEAITLSDPYRDAAERGWPGQMLPPTAHDHPDSAPDTVHNAAAYVSHDSYGIMRTTGAWGPQGYARSYADIANFVGLNFAPAQENQRGSYHGGQIITLVDYALALAPRSELTTLALAPAQNQMRAGENFVVDLTVWGGPHSVDTVDAYVDFDPAVLQVVDQNGDPATQIMPGQTLDTVTANGVNNTAGRIHFAATGDAVQGRFNAAFIRFKAITATQSSAISFSLTAPRQSDVSVGGHSVLDNVEDSTVQAGPAALVAGTTVQQGRPTPPHSSWQSRMLLSLGRAGERGPAYVYGLYSNQNGAFAMPGIATPGDYRLRLKGLHTLRNLLPTTLSPGLNAVAMETLLEGDAWGDNRIDVRDVSLLARSYGTTHGSQGYDPRCDFNQDGLIDQADVSLLQANLGQRGDVLVGMSAASLLPEALALDLSASSTQTATASLRLDPASTTAVIGDVVVLDVVVDSGDMPVDAAEIHLDYDPALLQAVDANGDLAAAIEAGTTLNTVLLNHIDPARGRIDYVAASMGATPPQGQFVIARLRLRALQAGETWVRFSFDNWRTSDVTYQGVSVLHDVQAAALHIGLSPLYMPMVLK